MAVKEIAKRDKNVIKSTTDDMNELEAFVQAFKAKAFGRQISFSKVYKTREVYYYVVRSY